MDKIDELAQALARLPGIGPRQGKRFVFHLLSAPATERTKLAELIASLGRDVRQCPDCMRFFNGSTATVCNYCADGRRDDTQLMLVEKDQDLSAIERAGTYRGRYFVLGGVLTLTGKGGIREWRARGSAPHPRVARGARRAWFHQTKESRCSRFRG